MRMSISVIIPVYKAGQYLRQACRSALEQPETSEVILVEDGSPDDSLACCNRLADADTRVRVLRHTDCKNHGASASRNVGIQAASGNYIAFLDADDYYLPGRFTCAVDMLTRYPDIDGVYEALENEFADDESRQRWRTMHDVNVSSRPEPVDSNRLFEAFVCESRGWFHTNCIVVRKDLFDKTGLFDVHLKLSQDVAMWTKMSAVGRLVRGSEGRPVAVRRVHAGNRSLRDTSECRRSLHRMWLTVFVWALGKDLPESRTSALLLRYLESSEICWFGWPSWRFRKLCGLLRLPLNAGCHPSMVKLPGFKTYASDCCREIFRMPRISRGRL